MRRHHPYRYSNAMKAEIAKRFAIGQANRVKVIAKDFNVSREFIYKIGRSLQCQIHQQTNLLPRSLLTSSPRMLIGHVVIGGKDGAVSFEPCFESTSEKSKTQGASDGQ